MLAELLDRLLALPEGWVYGVIGILAGVENVFPPVPADTAVAVGAFMSAGGRVSAWTVFWITWVANVTTASLVYVTARTAGRSFFRGTMGRKLLRPRAMERLERLYRRHGTWGIFLSRFIPAARAVVPPFAGIAGLGAVRALVPMAVASAIWYGTLTYLAATVVANVDQIERFVGRINRAAILVIGSIVLVGSVILVLRRRTAK